MPYKQVYIVRKDLNMRKGKIASQVAHACTNLFLELFSRMIDPVDPTAPVYFKPIGPVSKELLGWLDGNKKKITVSVNSEQELKDIYQKAKDMGIPAVIVDDHGLTEFHGVHTLTVVGLGPWNTPTLDTITGELPLL